MIKELTFGNDVSTQQSKFVNGKRWHVVSFNVKCYLCDRVTTTIVQTHDIAISFD